MTAIAASPEIIQRLRSKLSEYDLYIICDGSGSMGSVVKSGSNKTRWAYMQECLQSLVTFACELDTDGIGVTLFHKGKILTYEGVTEEKAKSLFVGLTPDGSTPMAEALRATFAMAGASDKKDLIVVFGDGEPNSQADTIKTLVDQANRQSADNDCTVLFIQVGDDPDATAFLNVLDGGLVQRGAKFDIVDVKTVDEVNQYSSFEELLANAIVD